MRRINQIAEKWKSERDATEFKEFTRPVTPGNMKRQMVMQNMLNRADESLEEKKSFFKELKPMSEVELHDYLEEL
jgi:hypothetical protein